MVKILERRSEDIVVLVLMSPFKTSGPAQLSTYVEELLNKGKMYILLDLSRVTELSVSRAGDLVASLTLVASRGGKMKFFAPNTAISEIIETTILKSMLDIYNSEKDAVASFS